MEYKQPAAVVATTQLLVNYTCMRKKSEEFCTVAVKTDDLFDTVVTRLP